MYPGIVLLLLMSVTSIAQTPVDLGLKAGLSVPNLTSGSSGNPVSQGYGSRLGPDAAAHVEFHLSKVFSLQPQLEYASQGGKKNGAQAFTVPPEMAPRFPPGQAPPYLYANYDSKARLNYLILPVLAKYYFTQGKRWLPYIAAGPFVSFLLHAENVTSGTSMIYLDPQQTQPAGADPQSFDKKENITGELHRFNTGVSGHVGIGYKLSGGSLIFEAGGNYGLINIQKNSANGKNNTGALVLHAGYQFRL